MFLPFRVRSIIIEMKGEQTMTGQRRVELVEEVALLKTEYAQLNEIADWDTARMRERQIEAELETLLATMTEAEKAVAGSRYLELMREYWRRQEVESG